MNPRFIKSAHDNFFMLKNCLYYANLNNKKIIIARLMPICSSKRLVRLPLYCGMDDSDIEYVIKIILKFFGTS